ncbi:two-component system chemotaxis response regulator CheY [Bradyrhizobium ottawaense]
MIPASFVRSRAGSWKAWNSKSPKPRTARRALEICQRQLPDAVLLDWNMPVMDGFEFMGHMRRLPGGDQPKVVFCTTENNVAHIAQALSGGANEYIMKPFDKDIIADKFAEVGLIPVGQAMV